MQIFNPNVYFIRSYVNETQLINLDTIPYILFYTILVYQVYFGIQNAFHDGWLAAWIA